MRYGLLVLKMISSTGIVLMFGLVFIQQGSSQITEGANRGEGRNVKRFSLAELFYEFECML